MEITFVIARAILALYFITAGMNHFMKKQQMVQYAQSKGVRSASFWVVISGILLVLAGLGLLLGVYILWSLAILAAFLVVVSFLIHAFWRQSGPDRMNEMLHFRANIALAAALVMLTMLSVMGPVEWPYALL